MSGVRRPWASTALTAFSMRSACSGLAERVAQHHRGRQDGRQRIGHALARDVRRRAVRGFVQALVVGVQRGRRQHADRAGQHRGGVGQDVAEHVAGDDDVELLRRAHQLHRGVVDVHVLELDVRVFLVHVGDDVAPELEGFQHVGLVDAGHALAALARGLEGRRGRCGGFRLRRSAWCRSLRAGPRTDRPGTRARRAACRSRCRRSARG